MDTQNVSAQLYFKQLPADIKESSYGCDSQTYPYLSTCVDNVSTDANIEDAFQKQLDLSEYYKSPNVFGAMKQKYMEPTMQYENLSIPQIMPPDLPPMISAPLMIPVGPEDFLDKYLSISSFGSTNSILGIIVLIILIIIIVALLNNLSLMDILTFDWLFHHSK